MTTSPGAPSRAGSTIAIAAAVPPLLLGCATALMLAAGVAGRHPMWRAEALNMSEAAAARDVATIAALLDRGEDPNGSRPIRPMLLEGAPRDMTPLEAGVAAGRLEVVHLLWTRGAALDDGRRVALACVAQDHGYNDVAQFLAGAAAGPVCSP